jgi:hypothetical protein
MFNNLVSIAGVKFMDYHTVLNIREYVIWLLDKSTYRPAWDYEQTLRVELSILNAEIAARINGVFR